MQSGGALTAQDLTATSNDVYLRGEPVVAGDVFAARNLFFSTNTNNGTVTFDSATATNGQVAVSGFVPGSVTITGATSGASVQLYAISLLDLGDVSSTAGFVILDTTLGGGGGTISAGNVSAKGGLARLTALDSVTTMSISSTAAIDVDSTAGDNLSVGDLNAGTTISLDTSGSVAFGAANAGGAFTIGGTVDPLSITATGNVLAGSVDFDTTGLLTAQTIEANAGPIDIDADSVSAGVLKATGALTVDAAGPVGLTAAVSDSDGIGGEALAIGATTLPSSLTISGSTSGGSVDLQASGNVSLGFVASGAGNVDIDSTAGNISATFVSASGGDALLTAPGSITTGGILASNAIDVDSTAGGNLSLGTLSAGTIISLDTSGMVSAGSANAGGALSLGATTQASSASFSGPVSAASLLAWVAGGLTFGGVNQIQSISAITAGALLAIENDVANLSIKGLITAGGNDITIRNSGDVTLTSTGLLLGRIVALSAGGQFINDRGSDAINATDHWVVYSAAPAGNTFGGLDSGNTAIWNRTIDTFAPGAVTDNRYVFAFQPSLVVASTDTSKVYGTDLTGTLNGFYSVSGLQAGVAGAFLGDNLADILSGTPTITSTGSVANADVVGGPYVMKVDQGSLEVSNGYSLALSNAGWLIVTPKPIGGTVNVNDKTYDGTTAGTGTVSLNGVVVGDDIGTLGTTFTFSDKNAGTGKTVTVSGTTLTGADAGNYTLTVPASALADIFAKAITASVDVNDKTYDGTTAGTGTVSLNGVVVGDDLGTSGTTFTFSDKNAGTGKTVTVSGTTLTGADAGNYTLTVPVSALADIFARILVISADDQEKLEGAADPAFTYSVGGQGLVSGDLIEGALERVSGEDPGSYAINRGNLHAGTNYTIQFDSGTFTIFPEAAEPPALEQTPLRSQVLPGDVARIVGRNLILELTELCPAEDEACHVAQ
jgi:hypothetical protein